MSASGLEDMRFEVEASSVGLGLCDLGFISGLWGFRAEDVGSGTAQVPGPERAQEVGSGFCWLVSLAQASVRGPLAVSLLRRASGGGFDFIPETEPGR